MKPPSAYGKVVLFGEHAVIYGRAALAVGIPHGVVSTCIIANGPGVRVHVAPWGLDFSDAASDRLGEVLRRLSRIVPGEQTGMEAWFVARIPPRAGLGSSAALSVALVRSLARARQIELSDEKTRALAHELEKVFHGQASGLDDTVATYGGTCLFRRHGIGQEALSDSTMQTIGDHAVRVSCSVPSLVLGDTGKGRSTRKMVDGVRRLRKRETSRIDALFDEIDGCLSDGLGALKRGDPLALGAAMSRNQTALERLGVSCPEIDAMVSLAMRAGACGAKLTGAGGGGGVVAVAPGREAALLDAWRTAGFDAWRVVGSNPTERL